jgi:hypothetical protein
VLLYGSIDGFRRRMVLEGRHLLDEALERTERIRDRLRGVPGPTVMDDSVIGHDSVAEWDPLKLSVDVSALGITGYQARTWLQSEHGLVAQLGDARRVVCSLTYSVDSRRSMWHTVPDTPDLGPACQAKNNVCGTDPGDTLGERHAAGSAHEHGEVRLCHGAPSIQNEC